MRLAGYRGALFPASLIVGALVAAGCGSTTKASAPPTTAAPATTTPTTVAPTTIPTVPETTTTTAPTGPLSPLTGLPGPASTLNRSAVVVKIDNVDQARPQTGINQADVVYEEMVEGGLTRLAAVFQSQLPDPVGPIRSGRTTDELIIDNLNYPVFAYSGANTAFLAALRQQPVVNVNGDNNGSVFFRKGPNVAPHNYFANASALEALAAPGKGAPPALFQYRGAGQPVNAAPPPRPRPRSISRRPARRGPGRPAPRAGPGPRTGPPTSTPRASRSRCPTWSSPPSLT